MEKDSRRHPRFKPKGMHASIKIKLSTPLSEIMNGKVKILLVLPDTGIPMSITGIIKHHISPAECSLQYAEPLADDVFNDFIFECVKSVH